MASLNVLQGCRTIQLSAGYCTLVDESDYGQLSRLNWYVYRNKAGNCYAQANAPKKERRTYRMHRLLMGSPAGLLIDHRNTDGLDNRRVNLRVCDKRQNAQNTRLGRGSSKYKGVCFSRHDRKWLAQIKGPDGVQKRLGCFTDERDAARAYDEAAVRLFGDFARTNEMIFS